MALKTLLRVVHQKNIVNYTPILTKCVRYHIQREERRSRIKLAAVLFGSVLVGAAVTDKLRHQQTHTKTEKVETIEAGVKRPNLPTYSADEVSKHDTLNSFWVTYKHGVYDVTSFLPSHPGGEQILNAAGLSIEPFWNVYGMHKTQEIYAILESYRIGNLRDEDVVDHSDEEMWVKEPARDRRLVVRTARPFNAEIPMKLQVQHFDTPNELFYVRQHMPVPELDERTHTLRITIVGRDTTRVTLTLDELSKLPRASERAALMCAGNRRSEMNKVKPVKGLSWQAGAISNAVWSGVYLRDVLLHCGLDMTDTRGKHIIVADARGHAGGAVVGSLAAPHRLAAVSDFLSTVHMRSIPHYFFSRLRNGADIDATGHNFSTSIPLHMATEPGSRIVLATHMNGAPLPPDHGRPLRVVVPGAPAVRSVKWLESITISEDESPSHWHQKDYRSFNPSKTWETADFASAPPVYSLPVTSAICDPADGDTVTMKNGRIEVRGYAYSGGGAKILRVDVSADGGRSWREAELSASEEPPPHHYSWALWTASLPAREGEMELWVKATDSNFNTQPEKFDDIWNIRGILSNAYHKIKIHVK